MREPKLQGVKRHDIPAKRIGAQVRDSVQPSAGVLSDKPAPQTVPQATET